MVSQRCLCVDILTTIFGGLDDLNLMCVYFSNGLVCLSPTIGYVINNQVWMFLLVSCWACHPGWMILSHFQDPVMNESVRENVSQAVLNVRYLRFFSSCESKELTPHKILPQEIAGLLKGLWTTHDAWCLNKRSFCFLMPFASSEEPCQGTDIHSISAWS